MNHQEKIRYLILISFLVLFSIFSLRHFILGGGVAASVDALCPFGGFETLFTFIATGGFVPRILMSSLILAIGVLVTVIIFRRGFCGYICPFGTVQDLFGKLRKNKINFKYDKQAKYIKYLILILILVGTAVTGTLVFRTYDPFMTFFHFGKGIIWDYEPVEFSENIIGFGITIVVLIGSVFISRIWCRYLCPLAATMNIFTWFGFSRIKRNKKTCIDCKICDKKCPVGVTVSTVDSVKDIECINCNRCVNVCPKNSLSLNIFGKKELVTTYIVLLLLLFFAVIGAAKAVGIWQSIPTTSLEDTTGTIDSELIKGWMTLDQVAEASDINVQHFVQDFGLQEVPTNTPLKDIKNYKEDFETSDVRDYVANFVHGVDHIEPEFEASCPWGLNNDPAPGRCALYEDKNNDGLCDLSQ